MHYGNIKFTDISNGPGIRTSLFVSGCRNKCEFCFNKETWDFDYGKLFTNDTVKKILDSLSPNYVNGLTLLGGEPMEEENQEELLNLCLKVKEMYPNKTIWCFTGYTYDKDLIINGRKHTKYTDEFIKCLDVLVDGRFINELKDIRLQFRGSKNQRIIDIKHTIKLGHVVIDKKYF